MRDELGKKGLLSEDTRPTVVFEESSRQYVAENPRGRTVLRYRVDGRMIAEGERCDFLMGVPRHGDVYLIELKGGDLKKAASQILSTIQRIGERLAPYRVYARVVLSRVQRPAVHASIVHALERAVKSREGDLKYGSQRLSEQIE